MCGCAGGPTLHGRARVSPRLRPGTETCFCALPERWKNLKIVCIGSDVNVSMVDEGLHLVCEARQFETNTMRSRENRGKWPRECKIGGALRALVFGS